MLLPDNRVCIHWLMADPEGPIRTDGTRRFRMACQPEFSIVSGRDARTDDANAVTCPRCKAHPKYGEVMVAIQKAAEKKGK